MHLYPAQQIITTNNLVALIANSCTVFRKRCSILEENTANGAGRLFIESSTGPSDIDCAAGIGGWHEDKDRSWFVFMFMTTDKHGMLFNFGEWNTP